MPFLVRFAARGIQPSNKHAEGFIQEGERVFLLGRFVRGPERQHADVERPVHLQSNRLKLGRAMEACNFSDQFEMSDARLVDSGASRCYEWRQRGFQKRGDESFQGFQVA